MDSHLEGDIEPVTVAVEVEKIDTIKDAIKNVIKKSLAQDGKYQVNWKLRTSTASCLRAWIFWSKQSVR